MEEIGLALLGLGRAGSFHLRSLAGLSGVRLRAVFDSDATRAREVAEARGCLAAATAQDAIGCEGVDGVVVATPTRSHHGYVLQALEAGRGVLCEKPLGTSLAEIDGGFALAARRGLPLLVAFQRRFDPSFAEVIADARAGAAGTLQFIRSVSRDNPLPQIDYIRTSGGIFHDCLVHDFDLICQVAGTLPEEVFAYGSSFHPEIAALPDLDNVVVALRFPAGLLASVDVNRRSVYGYDQRVEVFGSEGMLQAENRHRSAAVRSGEAGVRRPPIDVSFPSRYREAYEAELACFVQCLRSGEAAPITAAEVRGVHRLADAAQRSYREGRPVALDADGAGSEG